MVKKQTLQTQEQTAVQSIQINRQIPQVHEPQQQNNSNQTQRIG